MSKYITYHNHDTMSILDSCLKTKDLVKWAKANNMSSVGVTNHGSMSSHIDLYKECIQNEIKPLLGIEFYITENKKTDDGKNIRDNYHLVAIAKNLKGWHNLIKLHNLSYDENHYYYDPRITLDELIKFKDGLIITSACIGGILGRFWMNNDINAVIKNIEILQKEFKEDFYLELQNHNAFDKQECKKQHDYNKFLMKLSKMYNIKCTIQNDSHYYLKEDWEAHQILLCKNTGSKLSNPKFSFDSHEYYLKNESEIVETFNKYPLSFIEECIENTSEIANKVEIFNIINDKYDCPSFGEPEIVYNKLHSLAYNGLYKLFTNEFLEQNPVYKERIEEELKIIKQVGYTDYFLILDDLFNFTNSNNIYTGIGRGSCCGSLVLYCMGITTVDPIKYNLLFSRFINPDRISNADCDIDISNKDRDKVVEYIKKRYGKTHVCNIGTYGELTAKASFKAVASILEVPFEKANKISSMMDSTLSLKDNLEQISEFREIYNKDELIQRVYKIALKLEGTYAQIGTHACGLVISSKPLDDVCPCMTVKDTKSKNRLTSTAFEMKQIDGDIKLLKFDTLGLSTLNIIQETEELIKKRHNISTNFKKLNIEDEKTYKMLSDGYTLMVFQFESPLMQRILKQVKPNSIEDLSCVTALARPGSLSSGLTEQFINRRNGLEKVTPMLEGTEELMKDSLQLPIYQENIMQISTVMAGFSGAEADTLRKYIGKKDPEKLKHERSHFVNGCINKGYTEYEANNMFDIFEKFGSYGFNKSHSVGYSLLSYATAYYKANYTLEYITSVLNNTVDNLEKLNIYLTEGFRLGINILPPDINESNKYFTLTDNNEIRFGLSAIKGLGSSAVNNIILAREQGPFKSIMDFIDRTSKVDKSALQALLKVGAFNSIEKNTKRWCMMCEHLNDAKKSKFYEESLDIERSIYELLGTRLAKKSEKYKDIVDIKRTLGSSRKNLQQKEELNIQQNNIIETYIENVNKHFLQYTTFSAKEKMINEQELLGFNISVNPYKRWNDFKKFFISNVGNKNLQYIELDDLMSNAEKYYDLEEFYTVGMLSDIKEIKTKKGQKMAKLTVECYGTKTTITVFPKVYENGLQNNLQKGNMVAITGTLVETNKQYTDEDYEIRFENIRQLNVLINENNKCIIDLDGKDRSKIDFAVKNFAYNEWKQNLPIEKCVMYRINGKYLILNGLCWINNPNKLLESIK